MGKKKEGKGKSDTIDEGVKGNVSTVEILSSANPEIFETPPRPGGYLKLMEQGSRVSFAGVNKAQGSSCICPSKKGLESMRSRPRVSTTTLKSVQSRRMMSPSGASFMVPSREFRISHSYVVKEKDSHYDSSYEDDEADVMGMHSDYSAMNMLAVTISTVMLMAAGISNIPDEYLQWTETYLECMKDDDDKYPYNIMGILNHIQYIKEGHAYKEERKEKKRCCAPLCKGGGGGGKDKPPPPEKKAEVEEVVPSPSTAGPYATQSAYTPSNCPNAAICPSPNQSYDNVRTLTTVKPSKKDKKR